MSVEDARALIAQAIERWHPRLLIASSFSREDILIIALAAQIEPSIRVVALDTGRLPEETHACAAAVQARVGVRIEWLFPERARVEALLAGDGPLGFRDDRGARHRCCDARKVEPLARALGGIDAWITGRRREQAITRRDLPLIEDGPGEPVKLNPLTHWSADQVVEAVRARGLPEHPLYAAGYASIGCAPCTRAVQPGEDERAGRWWWEEAEHKECGLHPRTSIARTQGDQP